MDDPIYNKHMGEWQDCVPRVVSVKTVEQPPFSLRDMPEGKNPGEVSEARIESLFLSETVRGRPNRCYRTRNPVTGELAEGDDIPENYAVDNLKILLRATRQQIVVPS
ncbi:MAG: hypothetical protein GTO54_03095 [Nitrososphaeria archaeon]|nr:hypothetical protein [Nitrososphaeria archaeon]